MLVGRAEQRREPDGEKRDHDECEHPFLDDVVRVVRPRVGRRVPVGLEASGAASRDHPSDDRGSHPWRGRRNDAAPAHKQHVERGEGDDHDREECDVPHEHLAEVKTLKNAPPPVALMPSLACVPIHCASKFVCDRYPVNAVTIEARNVATPKIHVIALRPRHAAMKNFPHRWTTIAKKNSSTRPQVARVHEAADRRDVPPLRTLDREEAAGRDHDAKRRGRHDAEDVDPRCDVRRLAVWHQAFGRQRGDEAATKPRGPHRRVTDPPKSMPYWRTCM